MSISAGHVATEAEPKEAWLDATVIRCGCGDPQSHHGGVCPRPRRIEHLGAIAYHHRNPLRRALWALAQPVRRWFGETFA